LANGNGAVRRWRLSPAGEGKLRAVEAANLGPAFYEGKLAVSASGSEIAWIDGAALKIARNGAEKSWPHGQSMAETLALSPNGQILAVGTRNGVGARIFDAASGRLLWKTEAGHGTHLAFSADSQWLAVGTDKGCHVFAADSGKLRWRRAPGASEEPTFWEIAFSPDGKFVAWTPKPSKAQILNAADGSEVLTLDYPSRRYITGLSFSPDGRWLAESSNEHNLHLWDLRELRRQLAAFGLEW
jgi:WD40 repeat protein